MRVFDKHWRLASVATQMRRKAVISRFYNGLDTLENRALMDSCTGFHAPTGSVLIFTRDVGHHSSGWWKNPQYERCWHLSVSFRVSLWSDEPRPKDVKVTDEWIDVFYGADKRYVWAEPPYTSPGKLREVWHYRVFCNPAWQPIVPHGEVYSRELTEEGWLSFSELRSDHARALAALEPLPGEQ